MATKKQQRRERKRRVHGTEYVAPQVRRPDPADRPARGEGRRRGGRLRSTGRTARPIPTPSWRRAIKRAPIFAVVMFVLIHYVIQDPALSTQGEALQAAFFAVVTIPLTYLADRMTYRIAQRRLGQRR